MSNFTALARGLVVFGPTAELLGGVRDVVFFATGPRAPIFPARVLELVFRAVFLEVARGAFLGVAFFLEVFFEVFRAAVFLPDDLLDVFFAVVRLAVFFAVVFLRAALGFLDVFFAVVRLAVFLAGVLFAVVFLFLRAADVFFLPDVFFAGAMAAGR